jgi:phosphoribosylanthranilate isomerase
MNPAAGRVRVKICGVTNRADAETAIALGADALGFNLFAQSKRCITLDSAAAWLMELPPFVTRVAVLVNEPLDEARRVAQHPAIDWVQFHGDEDGAYCAAFARSGWPFIKAVRLRDAAAVNGAVNFSTRQVLLDAHAGAAYGGTGTSLDLTLAAECKRLHPDLNLIVAGGLRPENVAEVVRVIRPFAVDVASGVETADPRRKDAEKIRRFIANTAVAS